MDAESIDRLATANPFSPFKLTLVDGAEITVRLPRKSHVSGDAVSLFGMVHAPGQVGREQLKIVPLADIVAAEALPRA